MGRSGSGVEVRAASIRIRFSLNGETIVERLTLNGQSLKPTPANVKYAHRVAADVKRRIAQGAFTFAEFFPDSPRAKNDSAPETFGHLADMWLESQGRLADAPERNHGREEMRDIVERLAEHLYGHSRVESLRQQLAMAQFRINFLETASNRKKELFDALSRQLAECQARNAEDGWRQCAKGQRATQWCGATEESIKQANLKLLESVIGEWEKPYGQTDGASFIDRLRRMAEELK